MYLLTSMHYSPHVHPKFYPISRSRIWEVQHPWGLTATQEWERDYLLSQFTTLRAQRPFSHMYYTVFGKRSPISWSVDSLWSLQPLFFMLISRPGIKHVRWVTWLGKVRQSHSKCHRLQVPRTGGILWLVEDTNVPHHSFCICDGDLGENPQTRRHPDTEAVLTGDICAAFLPRPGVHCNTETGGFWETSG